MLNTVSTTLNHFEVRHKYSAARRIFNTLLCVLRCDQTRSFMFDLLHMLQAYDVTQLFPLVSSPGSTEDNGRKC